MRRVHATRPPAVNSNVTSLPAIRGEAPAQPRPPRLVLRFAVYTAVGLAIAAAGILVFVRQHAIAQSERAVTFHANFVAESILPDRLRPSDFAGPVTGARRAQLDRFFARQVLVGGALRVTLFGADGRITYSSDPGLIGHPAVNPTEVGRALAGQEAHRVSSIPASGHDTKVFGAFAPVRIDRATPAGAIELDQDYAPIASAARKAFLPIAAVLEILLLALYGSLFPLLRRVTRRLRSHVAEIEHQALHDSLTGLPNRDLFRNRIAEALGETDAREDGLIVMIFDLDRFKEINDTLGHQSGDHILRLLAQRLRAAMRDTDTVARLGGDEFGVLAPGTTDSDTALQLAERVQRAMERPFAVGGLTLQVEASIGIAVFPEHGDDVETLIRHADVAMYLSKETHHPELYDPKHDHYSPDRLALVGELRRAIDERELVVYYQPRIELSSGSARTVEALIRWNHPERGVLGPGEFLPLAQHTGIVRLLTRYVLEAALRQCRSWRDLGLDVSVGVNLFSRDLLDGGLPDEVGRLLAQCGVEPRRLELEITEDTILSDPARTSVILEQLGARGVELAIDDFGTGYSSLNYLKRLPVDVLKIDRSFVSRMAVDDNDAVIVRSTIDLGHNLGLVVVAEGVESQETLVHLTELGCDHAQGFHLSPPVPADELTEWLLVTAPRVARVAEAGSSEAS
jgi:diguanylate cyclase (GGDEF)-like protein